MQPEPSEGAAEAVDVLIGEIQRWIGELGDLRGLATRTARLCRGTTSEPKALALLGGLTQAPPPPRLLAAARTRDQLADDRTAGQAVAGQLGVMALGEPGGLLDTWLD